MIHYTTTTNIRVLCNHHASLEEIYKPANMMGSRFLNGKEQFSSDACQLPMTHMVVVNDAKWNMAHKFKQTIIDTRGESCSPTQV